MRCAVYLRRHRSKFLQRAIFDNEDGPPSSVVCLRKQKNLRVRFYCIKDEPADAFGVPGLSDGDVGKRGRRALAPLHPVRPTGPAHPSGMQWGEKAAFLRTGRSGALRATVPHRCNPDRNAEFDSQRLGCSELWSEHHDAQDSNRFGRRDDCDSQFDVDCVGPSRRGHPRCRELWR